MSLGRLVLTLAEIEPSDEEILAILGSPGDLALSRSAEAELGAARKEFARLAEPKAVVEELEHGQARALVEAAGESAVALGLLEQSPAAAVFVATLGRSAEERVSKYFASGDSAAAVFLDAVASAAADRLATTVARYWWESSRAGVDDRVPLAFSPGYCGWPVTGQRALFALVSTGEVGVHLTTSCFMVPLKSVSGLLLALPAGVAARDPRLVCCANCREWSCVGRESAHV